MPIILSSLDKAINSLDRAIIRSVAAPEDEELRDAVIQRFEYTYELCWKLLKRRLESDSPNPALLDTMNFKDMIRLGAETGYIAEPQKWFEYREQRNKTVHIYDEREAKKVYQAVLGFITDAKLLYENLLIGNDD
ncbi:MAG: nucleotidyltransferase [Candidatus Cloacimonetes bacterium HGW-Cloacimonetes-3]|nr:MAG: nucleotidyltransferase [Candidatus Cloacimonetes bacterium HGW-Cloacimonetes-3]